jgi:predicted kinase
MQKQVLYIFVGFPGAGKTTISKLIHKQTGAEHIWADHERHVQFKPVTYSKEESKALYERLNKLCEDYLIQGKSVIYDTNFNFYEDRELLRSIAIANNAEPRLIWVTTPSDIAKSRAIELDPSSETRVLGIMSSTEFERISNHLETPKDTENPIIIDNSNLSEEQIRHRLSLG